MASYKVTDKQTFFDVAIQQCGNIETVFALALENNLSITDDLAAGQTISLIAVNDSDIANYFGNRNIVPATGITTLTEEQARIFDETFDATFN